MDDYGNARIAARRAGLLPPDVLARLASAESAEAMLLMLERVAEWGATLRELGPLVTPPRSGIELAIERRRSAALAGLARLFAPPARALVEALVMGLDLERVLEVLRRRRAGEPAETVAGTVSRGAVLDDAALGALARAGEPRSVATLLGRLGLLSRDEAADMARGWQGGTGPAQLEAGLVAAFDAARRRRAGASGDAGRHDGGDGPRPAVISVLDAERAEARAVHEELLASGPGAATELERQLRLARLDALAARSRRDPLGIGVAIGYVAAVDAEAVRLRAALASVAGGWSRERAGAWLAPAVRAA